MNELKKIHLKKKRYTTYISFYGVKVRDLIYKNPIHIFFKLTVYIGKGGQKTNFTFNSISYTYDNQLFMLGVKNNI